MKLCPIAIAVGCRKCPAYKICPLKGVIGDAPAVEDAKPDRSPTKPGKDSRRKRS